MKTTFVREIIFVFECDDIDDIPLDVIIEEYAKIDKKKYTHIHLSHTGYPDYTQCIAGTRSETPEECEIREEKQKQETMELNRKERARLEKSIQECQKRLRGLDCV